MYIGWCAWRQLWRKSEQKQLTNNVCLAPLVWTLDAGSNDALFACTIRYGRCSYCGRSESDAALRLA
jgi:hypothetical protein